MIKNDKTLNQTITVYDKIRSSILNAQRKIYAVVNSSIVESYWEIGEQIYKECGESDRAEYGKSVLKYLSQQLTKEFGKGFTIANLRNMRQFYLTFPKRYALRSELSWTHYRIIMRVDNPRARDFYLNECGKAGWSSRQLERQVNSFFYERILSSKDKESTAKEIETLEPKTEINFKDILKEPYILEFLNLSDSSKYHEKDIEQGLIDHLQKFLLELGRGFSFVARQKRITFDDQNFYIDLVFYNSLLRTTILIDLKLGKLTHQDLGQMQMYTNYYTRELMNEGDNPPIGLVLCADKSDSVVRYTLPEDNTQIFASKYKLYLPTEEELRKELNLDNIDLKQLSDTYSEAES